MTTAGEEPVPSFQQIRILRVCVTRLLFWLGLISSQFKEIINHNLQIIIIKKKGGGGECGSSTHISTSSTLGQLSILKKKKKFKNKIPLPTCEIVRRLLVNRVNG